MSPGFIVTDDPSRRVIGLVFRNWLVTVRLTTLLLVRPRSAKLFRHATKAPLAAANIEGTLLARGCGVCAALCFGIAI
jgi:hypothetical protein